MRRSGWLAASTFDKLAVKHRDKHGIAHEDIAYQKGFNPAQVLIDVAKSERKLAVKALGCSLRKRSYNGVALDHVAKGVGIPANYREELKRFLTTSQVSNSCASLIIAFVAKEMVRSRRKHALHPPALPSPVQPVGDHMYRVTVGSRAYTTEIGPKKWKCSCGVFVKGRRKVMGQPWCSHLAKTGHWIANTSHR
jgi:hypothetical protein